MSSSGDAIGTERPFWAEVAAVKALERGDASPEQQRRALDFIVNKIARTNDMTWLPDSERGSSYLSGRRHVGLMILRYINKPIKDLPEVIDPPQHP